MALVLTNDKKIQIFLEHYDPIVNSPVEYHHLKKRHMRLLK